MPPTCPQPPRQTRLNPSSPGSAIRRLPRAKPRPRGWPNWTLPCVLHCKKQPTAATPKSGRGRAAFSPSSTSAICNNDWPPLPPTSRTSKAWIYPAGRATRQSSAKTARRASCSWKCTRRSPAFLKPPSRSWRALTSSWPIAWARCFKPRSSAAAPTSAVHRRRRSFSWPPTSTSS